MKTLLVCIDFSDVTDELLAQAQKLAPAISERIVLLNVATANPNFGAYEPDANTVRQVVADAFQFGRTKLEGIADDLRASLPNLEIVPLMIQGSPVEEITEHAASLPADLILMGTHGLGGLLHLLAGSVAQSVLKLTTTPVLLVSGETE